MSQEEHDRRIDYVEFGTRDVPATKNFYAGVFGWTFTDFGPDYTSFGDGRLTGGFTKTPETTDGTPLIVLYASDLEAVKTEVEKHGGKIRKDIFEFPGGRRFHFLDPNGNELAVWSDR